MNLNWSETRELPPLDEAAVHVWAVPLSNLRSPRQDLERLLNGEELARAARFLRDEKSESFVAARAGLRTILGRYLNQSPADVRLEVAPNGKPRLADNASGLQFNLAHSGDLALVAVTRGGEIGVDVELLRRVNHWRDIATRYFHPSEIALIGKDDTLEHHSTFFRCWTRKEAVLKAIGVGIIFPLDAFEVPLDETISRWVEVPAHSSTPAARYWLESLAPAAGYVGAYAVKQPCSARGEFTLRV